MKARPVPEPAIAAHCNVCGEEVEDAEKIGEVCGRDMAEELHPDAGICGGAYVEGPLPVFTLTRLEEIDVTYDVKALTLAEAFDKLRAWDEPSFVARQEDAAAWFEAGDIRYLGEDDNWHYEGAAVQPVTPGR